MAGGGGAVGLTSGALALAFQGQPIGPMMVLRLRPYAAGETGTANQRLMGMAAGLYVDELRDISIVSLDKMLRDEELQGPCCWEVWPPDTHGGMYALAHVAIIGAALRYPDDERIANLAQRAAVIVGQQLRMGDLIATPDGDRRGWPGARAPHGHKMDRFCDTKIGREVRGRQGMNLPHRGPGGGVQPLKWNPADDADRLYNLPPVWLKQILDGPGGQDLLDGPFSRTAALPSKLRLPVTVYRWDNVTLAAMADPGPEERHRYSVRGSMAAKRDEDNVELPVVWIMVTAGAPAKPAVMASQSWEIPPPMPPAGASRIVVGDGSLPAAPPAKPPVAPPNPPDFGSEEMEWATGLFRQLRADMNLLFDDLEKKLLQRKGDS